VISIRWKVFSFLKIVVFAEMLDIICPVQLTIRRLSSDNKSEGATTMGAKKTNYEKDNPALFGWSKWHLISDKDPKSKKPMWRIKRTRRIEGSIESESIPRERILQYSNRAQLTEFVRQLNVRHKSELERAKEAYEFKHTFITEKLIGEFEDYLKMLKRKHVTNDMLLLRRQISWFVNKLQKPDPKDWQRDECLMRWVQALTSDLSKKDKDALEMFSEMIYPDTVKKYVYIINTFLKWLCKRLPDIYGLIELKMPDSVMTDYRKRYGVNDPDSVVGTYIEDEDWKVIEGSIDERIRPYVRLGYYFGLRMSEAMGLQLDDVLTDNISIERQLVEIPNGKPVYGPPKTINGKRRIPCWFMKAEDVYEEIQKFTLMHPNSYSDLFKKEMARFESQYKRKFPYATHDMRRTWVTRALDLKITNPIVQDITVMKAAGHSTLNVTIKYIRTRKDGFSNEKFVPKIVKR
jgi:integrase